MKQTPLLTIPDEALDALTGKLPERTVKLPNPKAQMAIKKACNETIRESLFGDPTKGPSFRSRLLMWSSFKALMA